MAITILFSLPPGPFTLAWTSAANELTNLSFSITPALLAGDSVTLYLDNDADVTSPFATSAANVIDSAEAASGSLTFTGITTPLSPGLTYAKVTVVRGIYTVDSSIASQTLTGGYVGPGDVVSGAAFWGGLRAYSGATAGTAAIRIRATGDNAETDINTTAGGALDVAAVSAFLTTHGGNAFVVKIYDQSGNGRYCEQVIAAQQPQLVLSGFGAFPVMRFVRTSNQEIFSASFTRPQPFSHSVVAKRTGFFTDFAGVLGNVSHGTGFSGNANKMLMYAGAVAEATATDNVMHAMQSVFNQGGTGAFAYVDGVSTGPLTTGTTALSGTGAILGNLGGSFLQGDICEVGEWSLVFSPAQAASLDANQSTYWGV